MPMIPRELKMLKEEKEGLVHVIIQSWHAVLQKTKRIGH